MLLTDSNITILSTGKDEYIFQGINQQIVQLLRNPFTETQAGSLNAAYVQNFSSLTIH